MELQRETHNAPSNDKYDNESAKDCDLISHYTNLKDISMLRISIIIKFRCRNEEYMVMILQARKIFRSRLMIMESLPRIYETIGFLRRPLKDR